MYNNKHNTNFVKFKQFCRQFKLMKKEGKNLLCDERKEFGWFSRHRNNSPLILIESVISESASRLFATSSADPDHGFGARLTEVSACTHRLLRRKGTDASICRAGDKARFTLPINSYCQRIERANSLPTQAPIVFTQFRSRARRYFTRGRICFCFYTLPDWWKRLLKYWKIILELEDTKAYRLEHANAHCIHRWILQLLLKIGDYLIELLIA